MFWLKLVLSVIITSMSSFQEECEAFQFIGPDGGERIRCSAFSPYSHPIGEATFEVIETDTGRVLGEYTLMVGRFLRNARWLDSGSVLLEAEFSWLLRSNESHAVGPLLGRSFSISHNNRLIAYRRYPIPMRGVIPPHWDYDRISLLATDWNEEIRIYPAVASEEIHDPEQRPYILSDLAWAATEGPSETERLAFVELYGSSGWITVLQVETVNRTRSAPSRFELTGPYAPRDRQSIWAVLWESPSVVRACAEGSENCFRVDLEEEM